MKQIFVCGCEKGGKIPAEKVAQIRRRLDDQNTNYTYIEDLCGSIPRNPQDVFKIKDTDQAIMIGCQPRAMQCLMDYIIFCMCGTQVEYLHADTFLTQENQLEKCDPHSSPSIIKYTDDWKPWYPVIDYDRCTNCQKCQNFCLFGVYETDDEGKVIVRNPANCKDLCPACARACPEHAIIFPKHHEETIDGSDVPLVSINEDSLLEKIQNEDVYAVLNKRREKFKTPLIKTNQMDIAIQERRSCCSGSLPKKGNNIIEEKSK